ncbi:MAG: hypothetical protein OXS32_08295 [Verrucomicrobiales bacterium]|nr:hypothetical protein [Verrucomicrobiales bacterium]
MKMSFKVFFGAGCGWAGLRQWIRSAGRVGFITVRVNAISITKRLAKREPHVEGRQVGGTIPGGITC